MFSVLALIFAEFSILISLAQSSKDSVNRDKIKKLTVLLEEATPADSTTGEYLKELISLHELSGEYEKMAALTIELFHHPSASVQDLGLKRQYLRRAISYENELSDSEIRGNLHLKLAGAYYNLQQFDSAIIEYGTAIVRFSDQDSIYIADSYFFRAQAKDYQGDLLGGMKDYQRALDIYQAIGDMEYIWHVKAGMAILFSKFAIYNEAEEIRKSLISIYEDNGLPANVATQLYNQSEDYGKQGRFGEQLEFLKRADSLAPFEPREYYLECLIKLSLSIYYGEHGMLQKQRQVFAQAKELLPHSPEIEISNPVYLNAIALLEFSQRNIQKSNQLAQKSFDAAKESRHMDHLIKSSRLLAATYQEMGQSSRSYQILQELTHYTDSIFAVNQATTFSYYQTLYETEKKEKEILTKTQQLELISQQNQARLRWIVFGVTFFLIVGIFLFLYKNWKHEKKKKELQSRFSQELLKNQESERIRISKDLHDGLGQSLLMIKNKVALNMDSSTGELLDTAINELRAIARSLHPMQLEKLGLSKATEYLLDQLDRETEIFVSSEIEDLKEVLKKEEELQLYRILQESINNVLKHSEANALRVALKKIEIGVELKIEDNGKGFDFSEKLNDFQSLGLKTLKERIASIKGSMKVTSEKGVGTSLSFIVYV